MSKASSKRSLPNFSENSGELHAELSAHHIEDHGAARASSTSHHPPREEASSVAAGGVDGDGTVRGGGPNRTTTNARPVANGDVVYQRRVFNVIIGWFVLYAFSAWTISASTNKEDANHVAVEPYVVDPTQWKVRWILIATIIVAIGCNALVSLFKWQRNRSKKQRSHAERRAHRQSSSFGHPEPRHRESVGFDPRGQTANNQSDGDAAANHHHDGTHHGGHHDSHTVLERYRSIVCCSIPILITIAIDLYVVMSDQCAMIQANNSRGSSMSGNHTHHHFYQTPVLPHPGAPSDGAMMFAWPSLILSDPAAANHSSPSTATPRICLYSDLSGFMVLIPLRTAVADFTTLRLLLAFDVEQYSWQRWHAFALLIVYVWFGVSMLVRRTVGAFQAGFSLFVFSLARGRNVMTSIWVFQNLRVAVEHGVHVASQNSAASAAHSAAHHQQQATASDNSEELQPDVGRHSVNALVDGAATASHDATASSAAAQGRRPPPVESSAVVHLSPPVRPAQRESLSALVGHPLTHSRDDVLNEEETAAADSTEAAFLAVVADGIPPWYNVVYFTLLTALFALSVAKVVIDSGSNENDWSMIFLCSLRLIVAVASLYFCWFGYAYIHRILFGDLPVAFIMCIVTYVLFLICLAITLIGKTGSNQTQSKLPIFLYSLDESVVAVAIFTLLLMQFRCYNPTWEGYRYRRSLWAIVIVMLTVFVFFRILASIVDEELEQSAVEEEGHSEEHGNGLVAILLSSSREVFLFELFTLAVDRFVHAPASYSFAANTAQLPSRALRWLVTQCGGSATFLQLVFGMFQVSYFTIYYSIRRADHTSLIWASGNSTEMTALSGYGLVFCGLLLAIWVFALKRPLVPNLTNSTMLPVCMSMVLFLTFSLCRVKFAHPITAAHPTSICLDFVAMMTFLTLIGGSNDDHEQQQHPSTPGSSSGEGGHLASIDEANSRLRHVAALKRSIVCCSITLALFIIVVLLQTGVLTEFTLTQFVQGPNIDTHERVAQTFEALSQLFLLVTLMFATIRINALTWELKLQQRQHEIQLASSAQLQPQQPLLAANVSRGWQHSLDDDRAQIDDLDGEEDFHSQQQISCFSAVRQYGTVNKFVNLVVVPLAGVSCEVALALLSTPEKDGTLAICVVIALLFQIASTAHMVRHTRHPMQQLRDHAYSFALAIFAGVVFVVSESYVASTAVRPRNDGLAAIRCVHNIVLVFALTIVFLLGCRDRSGHEGERGLRIVWGCACTAALALTVALRSFLICKAGVPHPWVAGVYTIAFFLFSFCLTTVTSKSLPTIPQGDNRSLVDEVERANSSAAAVAGSASLTRLPTSLISNVVSTHNEPGAPAQSAAADRRPHKIGSATTISAS